MQRHSAFSWLAAAALLATSCGTTPTNKPAVEAKLGARVLRCGVFDTEAARPGIAINNPDDLQGRCPRFQVQTTKIEPIVGVRFGFEFEIEGFRAGEEVNLTSFIQHAPMERPDGSVERRRAERFNSVIATEKPVRGVLTCVLRDRQDLAPGPWRLSVWNKGRPVLKQDFVVLPRAGKPDRRSRTSDVALMQ